MGPPAPGDKHKDSSPGPGDSAPSRPPHSYHPCPNPSHSAHGQKAPLAYIVPQCPPLGFTSPSPDRCLGPQASPHGYLVPARCGLSPNALASYPNEQRSGDSSPCCLWGCHRASRGRVLSWHTEVPMGRVLVSLGPPGLPPPATQQADPQLEGPWPASRGTGQKGAQVDRLWTGWSCDPRAPSFSSHPTAWPGPLCQLFLPSLCHVLRQRGGSNAVVCSWLVQRGLDFQGSRTGLGDGDG